MENRGGLARSEAAHTALPTWGPVLPAQHGMILNYLRFPDDGVDIIQCTLDWSVPLERGSFEEAWRTVAGRHSILRTVFRLDGSDGLIQVADPDAPIDFRCLDLPPPPPGEPDHPFESFLRADRRERFDVTKGPLIRLTAVCRVSSDARPFATDGQAYRAVLTFHHALLDGRSLRLLVDDVSAVYAAVRDGQAEPNRPRPEFQDFVRWWHMTDDPSASEQFWTDYLAGTVLPRPIPGYLGGPVAGAAEPMTVETVLSRADSDLIRQAAKAVGLNSSTMISAALALLRARYGGVSDIVLAVTRSCRRDSVDGADDMIGLLINTVPLRVRIGEQRPVRDLLTAVNDSIRQIRAHQRTPMGSALTWAGLPADTALVDCLVMFDRHRLQVGLPDGDAAPVAARLDRLPSYPLTVLTFDEPAIHLSLICDRYRFVAGSVSRILDQLRATLIEFASKLDVPLAELDFGRAAEAEILARWNRTPGGYRAEATIPALFAAQVARDPDATALVAGATRVSYAELDRRSNGLAWLLRGAGVSTDEPVAVAIERGPDLIIALLAVLKAGGAYLPIEAGIPATRVTAMIVAAGVKLALATAKTAADLPELAGVDVVLADAKDHAAKSAPPPDLSHPLSLAYVSFTSGSTGVPKGVAVPQRAVIRLISNPRFAPLGPGQRLLHLAPVAFDASILEIWGGLLTGATVVVAPPGPLGLPDVASLLRTADVTVVWLTAGLFHQLAETDIEAIAGIPVVMSGGDVLSPDTVRALLAVRHGAPVVNGYGPTENTTFTTCHVMTEPGQVGPTVPIGRPIQHTTVHIFDERGRPAPIGVVGELHAGGDGLARGYAGNPGATARAFVPDPSGLGTRLYRTGDLARWQADGTIEFVGRADDQIKIRGFRVEPGEVAAALRGYPGVAEAVVVVAGEDAQRHLIGYVTAADDIDQGALRPAMLREYLTHRLPEYLVPAGFKVVERFPLNANGKIDRAALPEPDQETEGPASPPRGATEERLAEIWALLLPSDPARGGNFGRDDSFFALGGNSLLAARLMFRIGEEFEIEVRMAEFYETPTLAACAAVIDAAWSAERVADSAPSPAATAPAIGRRDRGVNRKAVAPTPEPASASAGIGRRDRSAYRKAARAAVPDRPDGLASHLIRLTDDWALWRTVCLRGAGFPIQLLAALGDADLAHVADAVITADASDPLAASQADLAYAAEFPAAVGRLSASLYEAAIRPALREAVAWQNRHALTTGIDPLVRRGPEPAKRNGQHRQHEALVASYLQRYCAKNDTIGFFGPVGWSQFDDGRGIRITHAASGSPLAARVTYLEGWAVRGIMSDHLAALRPWLVPRRMPFLGLQGSTLRLPLAPPVPLTRAEAAVMRACDGIRNANEIAALVLDDPKAGISEVAEVFMVIARLADRNRLAWQFDIAPQDLWPERSARAVLAGVSDDGVRAPAEKALDELAAAHAELAAAAGDAERVAGSMASLEATFSRLSGAAPTRRAGELYAGRTLAYEECLRGDTVRLGQDVLDGIRHALALVLDSARWFMAEVGQEYAQHFEEAFRQRAAGLGSDAVPFTDFWILVNEALFGTPPAVIEPAVRELLQRWAAVLDLPPGATQVQLRSADLRQRAAEAFPARPLPWPMAVHHSPDLMIAGARDGKPTWVLGEVHPSIVTTRYATWLEFHDDSPGVQAAIRSDLRLPAIWLAETGEKGGTSTRLSNVVPSADDIRLVSAHDSCGYDIAITVAVGDCDLIATPHGLRVRRRDGTFERGLFEVVGDLVATMMAQCFELVGSGQHRPRVTIDDLVVSREQWTFAAAEATFADNTDERTRYLRAREWVAEHGLPRHVFCRFTGEVKPIYADLTSLASIDLLARSVRRSRRNAGADARLSVVEMLPAPDQIWLTDAQGQRYTSELRMVAVDQKAAYQAGQYRQEG
jgi:amino acid adenylation domain-containing protein